MLVPLFAALAITNTQQKAPLPNGVSVYAERIADSRGYTLVLFLSTFGHPEQKGRDGYRHLLEHLTARGRDKDLDAKLEEKGLTLSANTLPDGIRFEIEGGPGTVPDAVAALKDLLALATPTQEEIEKEAKVIAQESAVRTPGSALTAALRVQAFEGQTDLMGQEETLAKATPDDLQQLFASIVRPEAVSVAIVGDIMQLDAVDALTKALQGLQPKGKVPKAALKPLPQTQEGFVPTTSGEARGVVVDSMAKSDTLAVLAAAFALASETQGARVVYTPSPIGGLVSVVHGSRGGLSDLDRLIDREADRLVPIAKRSVARWAMTTDQDCREKARAYAQMLLVEPYFRMQDIVTRASETTDDAVRAALERFKSGNCVRAGGAR